MSEHRCTRCGAVGVRSSLCAACLLDAPAVEQVAGMDLLEPLGEGGMGSVFRARHPRLQREVAVKFLHEAGAAQPDAFQRFAREARILARLHHPNIVAVHDFGEEDGVPYLVMELAPGGPLSARLPLSVAEALHVATQLCDALDCAHAQGVVHRDLKPQNLIVDDALNLKVADFGIARVVRGAGAEPALTRSHVAVGTPGYMAPEALAGAAPDERMDTYAVGLLLEEMVTGQRAEPGKVRAPGALAPIVRRAVSLDPTRRYPSARSLKADLLRAAAGADTRLPPDERLWLRAAALLCALATALVLWSLLVSLTPRVVLAGEVPPLIAIPGEPLPDGRYVLRARFETGPILGATAGVALALFAVGMLRRHWRLQGLDVPEPDAPLEEVRWVFWIGMLSSALYVVHRGLVGRSGAGLLTFIPLVGGTLELVAAYRICEALLEAWRRSRPLAREPRLWVGAFLVMIPPVSEFFGFLGRWKP